MSSRERAKLLVEEAEVLTATDLRAALSKLREAILVDPDYPDLEDEIFLREDAIAKLDGVLEYIVVLLREGKEYNACQMLKDLPENYVIQDKSGLVKNLTENDKKLYKVKKGVKITGVPEVYRRDGLELVGSVILEIDGQPIDDIQDARVEFGKITRYGKTVITLLNKKGERERVIFQ